MLIKDENKATGYGEKECFKLFLNLNIEKSSSGLTRKQEILPSCAIRMASARWEDAR